MLWISKEKLETLERCGVRASRMTRAVAKKVNKEARKRDPYAALMFCGWYWAEINNGRIVNWSGQEGPFTSKSAALTNAWVVLSRKRTQIVRLRRAA